MKLQGMRALVTGSTGFLGKALVKELGTLGAEVIGVSRRTGIDVREWSIVQCLPRSDIVFHLAGSTGVKRSFVEPRDIYESNILGVLNLLEYCRKHSVRKLILASTYVYGDPRYLPVDELHPVEPSNPYAESKLIAERLANAYYRDFGLPVVVLRVFNIYGPQQSADFLVPTVLDQAKNKNRIVLRGENSKRDFVYVDDVAKAFAKAAAWDGDRFHVFNIGSGKSYPIEEVISKLLSLLRRNLPVSFLHMEQAGEVKECVADIRSAQKELGWTPQVTLEEGLKQIIIAD